jgi:hypothetical protein
MNVNWGSGHERELAAAAAAERPSPHERRRRESHEVARATESHESGSSESFSNLFTGATIYVP